MNTNSAYGLGAQWLAAAGVDVRALERDCAMSFALMGTLTGFEMSEITVKA